MELKVWVDGIQRVVCGVSEQTTCQEVVIALAQAIGESSGPEAGPAGGAEVGPDGLAQCFTQAGWDRLLNGLVLPSSSSQVDRAGVTEADLLPFPPGQTGRFVLVQRLREKERQLLPEECPVGAQATCGQFASDVQFVLRRTGPSPAGRPSSDSCPPPERCPIRASLPAKPRAALGCEPCKALTPRPAPSLSPLGPAAPVTPSPGCCTDLRSLELTVRRNAEELGHEAFWEQELRREQAREREGQARLQALSAATAEHAARLQALDAQARALEAELRLAVEAPGPPSPTASATERLRQDLAVQERQSAELQGSLALVSRALEAAERALQVSPGTWFPSLLHPTRAGVGSQGPARESAPSGARGPWSPTAAPPEGPVCPQAQAQELSELNRELRQCNLQQFIQQTGAAPPSPRPGTGPPHTQGPLSPAREQSLLGPPLSPVLVPTLGPEGKSVSHLPLGPGALLRPQAPQPVSSRSGFREAELLEVAAAPAPERRPLTAQPQAVPAQ
ncbi:Ras association domain-containing protein 7 [Plecturocebus cupreus]